ncbi:MAG: IS5 family transposase [Patescibacteria group bacterium]
MKTSKSPINVARVAYEAAQKAIPAYSHAKSPKKFTQPQLIACLVLRQFFKTDYRGTQAILEDSTDLRKALELTRVPDYTTLHKAAQKFGKADIMRKLFVSTIGMAAAIGLLVAPVRAAIDGTGFESHHVSDYFVSRKSKGGASVQETTYTHFPKVGIVVDCATHLVLGAIPSRGPSTDVMHFPAALREALKSSSIHTLIADMGYDSEAAHVLARDRHGIESIIPPRMWKKFGRLPRKKYRLLMATNFDKVQYGQRWQVETVNSMVKRNLGSALRATKVHGQYREIRFRLFTHNAMVV